MAQVAVIIHALEQAVLVAGTDNTANNLTWRPMYLLLKQQKL